MQSLLSTYFYNVHFTVYGCFNRVEDTSDYNTVYFCLPINLKADFNIPVKCKKYSLTQVFKCLFV